MTQNHARSLAVKALQDDLAPVKIKHTEALKLLADERCLELCGVIAYLEGEVRTHADAAHVLDNDPRFKVLCETCGWTLSMICPECLKGCGCEHGCSGWRHAEDRAATGEDEDDPYEDGCDECGGGTGPYDECVCE